MFTGIIEATGSVTDVIISGSNKTFWIESPISNEFTINQSVAHDGVCLTVEAVKNGRHKLTAIDETLAISNVNSWAPGHIINLERSITMSTRLDGHIVQGHTDTVAKCLSITEKKGSSEFSFQFPKKFAPCIIEKGSVTVNGISLTAFHVKDDCFTVGIIPYTFENTNLRFIKGGDEVNIEFDLIGKYVNRNLREHR